MDMPQPMTANNYDKVIDNLKTVVKSVAEETVQDACHEIRHKDDPNDEVNMVADTAVSVYGTL